MRELWGFGRPPRFWDVAATLRGMTTVSGSDFVCTNSVVEAGEKERGHTQQARPGSRPVFPLPGGLENDFSVSSFSENQGVKVLPLSALTTMLLIFCRVERNLV